MPKYCYDHIHLISPNPQKAATFYENVFNAKRVADGTLPDGGSRIELEIEGTRLLIRTPKSAEQSVEDNPERRYGLEHFGLYFDDIEEAITDLEAKGVESIDIRASVITGAKLVFIMAPDNVLVEIVPR